MAKRSVFVLLLMATAGCDDCGGSSNGNGVSVLTNTPALYLKPDVTTKLEFEVDVIAKNGWSDMALAKFVEKLNELREQELLRKPSGIEILQETLTKPNGDNDHAYTFTEVQALVAQHHQNLSTGSTARAYILFLDGHDEHDTASSGKLGYAWDGDKIAIFPNTIAKYCHPGVLANTNSVCSTAEATVLAHEFGHLLGLVDNGLAMSAPHLDGVHGHHDTNHDCLMYWTIEGSDFVTNLSSLVGVEPRIPDFDEACKNDMAALHQQ